MEHQLSPEKIRKLARALDAAIESGNVEEVTTYFPENCEIELPGIRLCGEKGLRKALAWMYGHLKEITLNPVTIMVDGNTFFEEFIVKAKVKGKEIQAKQTEVLVYDDNYKVTKLRLYFDRLELAAAYTSNPIEKIMISQLNKASLKGLL